MTILITGATGNVGSAVLNGLVNQPVQLVAGLRAPAKGAVAAGVQVRLLDFENTTTWPAALAGITQMFLVRPPQISDVKRTLGPFLEEAKRQGVRQVVFLSLLGVENNPLVPHRAIEEKIRQLGFNFTMLRASFFMQNLYTTHRQEIRDRSEINVPAAMGRTSFVDVRDLAAVGVQALLGQLPPNQAYPLTGSEALTYEEVARQLSAELGRPIRYTNPSMLAFVLQKRREKLPWGFTLVMLGLYTACKLGLAAKVTPDLGVLLGRSPISLAQYIRDYREVW
ncbi:MAG: SDR family oxidoreductase [Rhodoferax sp.]|nr:SDR family oxidoreductase [Rhodoferax sp.]